MLNFIKLYTKILQKNQVKYIKQFSAKIKSLVTFYSLEGISYKI